jgi:oxalate decarboxylase/phosphoglucose isomerase-like protein (cupin superfamily)
MRAFPSWAFALLAASVNAQSAPTVAQLVAELRLAPGQEDQIALLSDDNFIFNFMTSTTGISTGSAGRTVAGSAENYPGVIGNGIAMTIGFLDPCGMNTPHTHPRATEINFAVNGTFRTGMLAENGARFVFGEVPPGACSVFPQGAIHFEQNNGCEPAMFVAAFNNEDPGVLQVAQRYFGLPPDIIGATLNGLGVQQVAELESLIPNNIAQGADECLQRCGITRLKTQLTSQRQPRVSGNALPSGFSGPTTAAATPSSTSTSTVSILNAPSAAAPSPAASSSAAAAPAASSAKSSSSAAAPAGSSPAAAGKLDSVKGNVSDNDGNSGSTTPVLIALVVLNGILALIIGGGIFYFIKNRHNAPVRYQQAPKAGPDDHERTTGYYDPYPTPAFKE